MCGRLVDTITNIPGKKSLLSSLQKVGQRPAFKIKGYKIPPKRLYQSTEEHDVASLNTLILIRLF